MSKSLGNALDPLDLIQEYGADALRFTLLTGGTPGNDIKLAVTRVEASRNFANKLWNAARFVIMNLAETPLPLSTAPEADGENHATSYALPDPALLSLADRWILSRFEQTARETTRLIEQWQLGEAGRQLYEFMWGDYCDWYIEAAKVRLYSGDSAQAQATRQVSAYVLEQSLRLLHPYMPFVTEAIWQNLPGLGGQLQDARRTLLTRSWPQLSGFGNAQADDAFARVQEVVRAIRNARSEYEVAPSKRITALLGAGEYADELQSNVALLAALARVDAETTVIAAELAAPSKAVTLAVGGVTVYLPLAELVDLDAERKRLQKEIENIDKQMQRITGLLANPGFTDKAPADVVERERVRLDEFAAKRQQFETRLREL
jgi:valyl-tRNA synthetase